MTASDAIRSALSPHGMEAAAIAEIAWVLFVGGGIVFIAVIALAAMAFLSPRPWLAGKGLVIVGGMVVPGVLLTALLVYTLAAAGRPSPQNPADLVIVVTGSQWWWRLDYLDRDGREDFVTANELRLPVGQVVELRLVSADVLHSFWVPPLAGKLDLIPGKDNRLRLAVDKPGLFRGVCAEYCGGPHARMAFYVVAQTPAEFEAWRQMQRRPQRPPQDAAQRRGLEVFLARCAACHALRGTKAAGRLGPDLSHLSSRLTLGAGILAMDKGALAAWTVGNQALKPGNLMPEFRLEAEELRALTAYLGAPASEAEGPR